MTDLADHYADVSSNTGELGQGIDIAAYAAAGHRRISVKATEGTDYHWFGGDVVADAAHAEGLAVEHYAWLRPEFPPVAQADYFVRAVEPHWRDGDDAMTDYERSYNYQTGQPVPDGPDSQRADALAAFQHRVAQLLAEPRVYTGNWYLDGRPALQAECRNWDIVMSDYADDPVPNPYQLRYVAIQFTDRAIVAGMSKPTDYNRLLAAPQPPPDPSTAGSGQMFEIIQDLSTGHWYAWAPGYWHHIAHQPVLHAAASEPLCVNGKAVRAGKKAGYQRKHGHVVALKAIATARNGS